MDKITSWLVVLIGIVLILPLLTLTFLGEISSWIIAIAVLIIGIKAIIKK